MNKDQKTLIGLEFEFFGDEDGETIMLTTATWVQDGEVVNATIKTSSTGKFIKNCLIQTLLILNAAPQTGIQCSCGDCDLDEFVEMFADLKGRDVVG